MCPELNGLMFNLQQAASSFSKAALREEASAHYIRPNAPILNKICIISRLWHFHNNSNFAYHSVVNHLIGWVKSVSTGCQGYHMDYFTHPAPKSKQGDIWVKSCSQSFACSVIFRQATRQDSPPVPGKLVLLCKIFTEALQVHFGPCWLFTSVNMQRMGGCRRQAV